MNDNINSWFNPLGMRIPTTVIISLVVLVTLLSFRCKRRLRCLTNRSSFSLGMVSIIDSERTIRKRVIIALLNHIIVQCYHYMIESKCHF